MSSKNFETLNVISKRKNELIDITSDVSKFVHSAGVSSGICYVYVPHTTAAVTINENADPSVSVDILTGLERIVRSDLDYEHTEGNSPAHIKSSIIGSSINVLIDDRKLVLGTWQGIYFCEFDGPRSRKVHVKIIAS